MDLTRAAWIKSSYSTGGECVEYSPSFIASSLVPVRDSKSPSGPTLLIPMPEWADFVSALKRGEL